jgi:hypothetical protein
MGRTHQEWCPPVPSIRRLAGSIFLRPSLFFTHRKDSPRSTKPGAFGILELDHCCISDGRLGQGA